MAFLFEELLQLDRPWIDVKLRIGDSERGFKIRRLNAADSDASEAFFADEYARLVIEKTDNKSGTSEMDRVYATYATRSRPELIDQVIGTRFTDINRRALEIGGEDLKARAIEADSLPDDEKEAAAKLISDELNANREQAREELAVEYDSKTDEELASLMAQVNINFKSINQARAKQNAHRLYYMLHDEAENRVFPSLESVYQLQTPTIDGMLEKIDAALAVADLPFASRDGLALDAQSPSPSTSAEDTVASGKPTRTPRKSSK